MKKLISLILAVVLVLSMGTVAFAADMETPSDIVIDGVKDDNYTDKQRYDQEYFSFWDTNGSNEYPPVDEEYQTQDVWFDFDDQYIYIYAQVTTKAELLNQDGTKTMSDYQLSQIHDVAIYLDVVPNETYTLAATDPNQTGKDMEQTATFDRNCISGAAPFKRLMFRAYPEFGVFGNFHRTAEGMFRTFEEFKELREGKEPAKIGSYDKDGNYIEDADIIDYSNLEAAYQKVHGDCKAVTFIDYEAGTYGVEFKFPYDPSSESFKFNFVSTVLEHEVDGDPEASYAISACKSWWVNGGGMNEVYYEDYIGEIDPAVSEVIRLIEALPAADAITADNKAAVEAARTAYEALDDALKADVDEATLKRLTDAEDAVAALPVSKPGDLNGDDKVDAKDALAALKHAVGKPTLSDELVKLGDLNGDGVLDAKDALAMLKAAVSQ